MSGSATYHMLLLSQDWALLRALSGEPSEGRPLRALLHKVAQEQDVSFQKQITWLKHPSNSETFYLLSM